MLIYNKQHVSNIWSSIHEKVKQHWGWVVKKSVTYKQKRVLVIKTWLSIFWWLTTGYAIVQTPVKLAFDLGNSILSCRSLAYYSD